jgi:peptide/nickel transport system permease protein
LILSAAVATAAAAPWVAPYGPNEPTESYLRGPSLRHPFGTDNLGRDVLSRVIYGSRASLGAAGMAVGIGGVLGAALGLYAGYMGGWAERLLRHATDFLMSLPGLLLALVIVAGLGASFLNVSLAIAVALVAPSARIARSSAMAVRQLLYIDAARILGAGHGRILLHHVLPNAYAPILVILSIQFGTAVLVEGSLSFLGLGVPLGTPSWGNMLSGTALLYMQRAPWMALFPGLALTAVVLSMHLLGDALRDALDPRLRGATFGVRGR